MAANQLMSKLPPLTLETGCIVIVEAIDPASGAAISGVTVSQVALYATNVTPGGTLSEAMDAIYVHSDDV